MFRITLYEKTQDSIKMEVCYSHPAQDDEFKDLKDFTNEEKARGYYWGLVYDYLNFTLDHFRNRVMRIQPHYFDRSERPFINDQKWQNNFWKFRELDFDEFYYLETSLLRKALWIRENKVILQKSVTAYCQLGFDQMKSQYEDMLKLSNEIITYCKTNGLTTFKQTHESTI